MLNDNWDNQKVEGFSDSVISRHGPGMTWSPLRRDIFLYVVIFGFTTSWLYSEENDRRIKRDFYFIRTFLNQILTDASPSLEHQQYNNHTLAHHTPLHNGLFSVDFFSEFVGNITLLIRSQCSGPLSLDLQFVVHVHCTLNCTLYIARCRYLIKQILCKSSLLVSNVIGVLAKLEFEYQFKSPSQAKEFRFHVNVFASKLVSVFLVLVAQDQT